MASRNAALMLSAALIVCLTVATPGVADDQAGPTTTKKTVRHTRVVQPSGYVGRPLNSCDYDRAAGRCMIDLGYGRCMECSGGPFK